MSETDLTAKMASPNAASPLAPERPTRVRYRVLAAGCVLAVVAYIHRVGFGRALPELHLNNEQSSWLTAVFLLAYGGFEMPCGLLGDRFGARHLLTVLILGWSLTTGLVGLVVLLPAGAAAFAFLVVLRFLFGMFQAGAFPLLSRIMTDWMPMRERGSAQGFIWMASRGGGLAAPLLFGALMSLFGSWETPLWLLAGVGLMFCVFFWPWFRNRPEEAPTVNAAEREAIRAGRDAKPARHDALPWGAMLRSPGVWGLCLMYGCGGFAANFYVTLLPKYLESYRHLSAWDTSWIAGLPFACGTMACLGGGFLSDALQRSRIGRKWGRRLNGIIGLTCGALGWLSLAWVESPWALGFVFCFIFFCNDLNMAPAWAACADIGEGYAGTVGGTMNMTSAILGAAGNLLAGKLFDRGQADLLFAVYAGAFVIAGLCWLLVDVTKTLIAEKNC